MKKNLSLVYCKGLPASGKTTWANEQVKRGQGSVVNVNKDDLRSMLHANEHSKGREELVLQIRDSIIISSLSQGKNVIVSDTNFHPKHKERFEEIINAFQQQNDPITVVLQEQSFCDVPLEVCIERDKNRGDKSVGEQVIRNMYNEYLKKDKTSSFVP